MSGDLQEKLERTLGAPLAHVYGATEAPLSVFQAAPPFARKPGSVGVAAGCDVRILGDQGEFLPPGQTGEVVLSGPHVMSGYLNDPAANAQAFHGRWFRTGDLGLLDEDGYLFLKGRIKELINRGGEKIAPSEIDEAMARHPAVAEAAAYPVPDERLGEEIAALVVLRPGADTTIGQLRRFFAAHLSPHKLPRWIQLASQIPRTAAGKVNRRSLAERFPVAVRKGCCAGSTCACEGASILENFLIQLWKKHLNTADVGRHTDFFEAGGDSLAGTELLLSLGSALGVSELGPSTLLEASSVEKMAVLLSASGNPQPARASSVVPFRVASDRPPFWLIAPGFEFRLLRNQMPPGQSLVPLGVPERLNGSPYSIEKIAEECLRRLRDKQPSGPYFLGGWCFAGVVAYEMASHLIASGESVPLLIGFDLPDIAPGGRPSVAPLSFWPKLRFHSSQLRSRSPREWAPYVTSRLQTLSWTWRRILSCTPSQIMRSLGMEPPLWLWNTALAQAQAVREYRPAPYPGRALHIVPRVRSIPDKPLHWAEFAGAAWETFEAPGAHLTMFENGALGARLRNCLQSLDPPRKLNIAAGN